MAVSSLAILLRLSAATVPYGTYLKDLPPFKGSEPEWEILTAEGVGYDVADESQTFVSPETKLDDAGIDGAYADEGYSKIIEFSGYSTTGLCIGYNRTAHIDGHDECPLTRDWHVLWPPVAGKYDAPSQCFIDDIRAYQHGNELRSPPGSRVVMNRCPGPDGPDDTWTGGYDWRYGGIRPQDSPDMKLYPEVQKYIEEIVEKNDGKKVVIKGYSGGTIASYAFLMHMTEAWRKQYVMAYIIVAPVFGGTISSINSVLSGWARGPMDKCSGRQAALFVPSVFWMWPRPGEDKYKWNRTEVVVFTESKNYTAYDLDRMLGDMGLNKVASLLDIEKRDLLDNFAPPMVDTYAFYGYGVNTQAGFTLKRDLSPDTDKDGECPPAGVGSISRPWDNGDGVGPLRSTSRAGAWEDAHKRAGVVLRNYGYQGQGHSCSSAQCKRDYQCVLDKLAGKPHGDC